MNRDDEGPSRPLPNTYWVIPDRVLAGEYPGHPDEALARHRLERLCAAGIDAFFDLTEEGELPPYHHLLAPRAEYLRSAIVDTWVPHTPAQTHELLVAMRAALRRRRKIYVHCRAGIGRTGLVVGCFLASQEPDGSAALKALNRLWQQSERALDWPRVPQTVQQADYIRGWPELARTVASRPRAKAPTASRPAAAPGARPSAKSPRAPGTRAGAGAAESPASTPAPAPAPAPTGNIDANGVPYSLTNPRFPHLIRRR